MFPSAFAVVALSALLLPRSDGEEKGGNRFRDLDHVGSVMATLGLNSRSCLASLGRRSTAGDPPTVLVSLAVSIVSLCAFVLNEARSRDPLLPLGLFRVKNVARRSDGLDHLGEPLFVVLLPDPVRADGARLFARPYGISFLVMPLVIAVFSGITSPTRRQDRLQADDGDRAVNRFGWPARPVRDQSARDLLARCFFRD